MLQRENRPRIKIELTPTDRLLEVMGWCILSAMWIVVIITYARMPESIPIHYNAEGVIDGYGNRSSIWGLLLTGSVLFIGMTLLNRFPHIFNYPTAITKENALRQYTIATKMMRAVKLAMVVVIGGLVFKTIFIALGESDGLGVFLHL